LEGMPEQLPVAVLERRRVVMPLAPWAVRSLPHVACDPLPAPVPVEDEVDDSLLGLAPLGQHELAVTPGAPPLGRHPDASADPRRHDAADPLVALAAPPPPRLVRLPRVRGTDADGSPVAALPGVPQDLLELVVDRLPGFGRMPFRPAGELDGGVRR